MLPMNWLCFELVTHIYLRELGFDEQKCLLTLYLVMIIELYLGPGDYESCFLRRSSIQLILTALFIGADGLYTRMAVYG